MKAALSRDLAAKSRRGRMEAEIVRVIKRKSWGKGKFHIFISQEKIFSQMENKIFVNK